MDNYEITGRFDTDDNIRFMNHGYYPIFPQYENMFMATSMSLYHYMVQNIDLTDKKILDIGCGRGGGANLLKQFNPCEIHACDLSPANIEFCKKHYDGIEFRKDDAMSLGYVDASFDVILNVESSHCYADKQKFFGEVRRVLKPDGVFLYADINASLDDGLFGYITREDITQNVLMSCEHTLKSVANMEDCGLKSFLTHLYLPKIESYRNRTQTFIAYSCYN